MNMQTKAFLQQRNATLRAENKALRRTMLSPPCNCCKRDLISPQLTLMENQLRLENERIKLDIERMYRFADAARRQLSLPWWVWNNNGASSSAVPPPPSSSFEGPRALASASWLNLAADSANEVIRMARIGEPIWNRNRDGDKETLNLDMYNAYFFPRGSRNVDGLLHEASRATSFVAVDALSLLKNLADPDRWIGIFPSIIATASIEARNRTLQVMKAEFLPIVSPLVPTRKVKFIRYFKRRDQDTWIVADVSLDLRPYHTNMQPEFIRFPSGYVIQRINNECSKITIVEHWGYKEDVISNRFRLYLQTGLGFGANRWLAALQRNGFSPSIPLPNQRRQIHNELSPLGKRNLLNLSRRMVNLFCTGVCGITGQNWKRMATDRLLVDNIRIFSRETRLRGNKCFLVSATGMVRMQAKPEVIFALLSDVRNLDVWEHLHRNGEMEEKVRVSRGPNPGNYVSIFCFRSNSSGETTNGKFVLQETYYEASASMIIHAAVDLAAAATASNGGDASRAGLLPSGFTIMPGCDTALADAVAESSRIAGDEWCVVTAGFQMMADEATLTDDVSGEMVNAVEKMVSGTFDKVRNALPVRLT